jgi:hypothetical protein
MRLSRFSSAFLFRLRHERANPLGLPSGLCPSPPLAVLISGGSAGGGTAGGILTLAL